ncbi:MAG: 3-deoxy-D-manno-octulosonic-acid transferase [Lentisphaeria bacterium]|jgi:3-deoxy-D-manno-octulosonic-acid transferase
MSTILRLIYSVLLSALFPFILIRMTYRYLSDKHGHRKAGPKRRFIERLGGFTSKPIDSLPPQLNGIVFHMVSVGETIAAIPLIEKFCAEHPDVPVTVTCTTPAGSKLITSKLASKVFHCYLPFDLPIFVHIFLARLQPRALIILETELWPNLTHACFKREIKTLVLNARLSQNSYEGYKKLSALTRGMMNEFSLICCQTQADADRFEKLGLDKAHYSVTGNLKFDISLDEHWLRKARLNGKTIFGNRPTWIAASTHEGEERIVLDAHKALLSTYPNLVLVLAPRHPERAHIAEGIAQELRLRCIKRTDKSLLNAQDSIYIVDTIGELMDFFAASQICLICGSLVPHGGHNPLEPALLKKPILTGKHVHNFTKIYDDLIAENAAIKIEHSSTLEQNISPLLKNPEHRQELGNNAYAYLEKHRGATKFSLHEIDRIVCLN